MISYADHTGERRQQRIQRVDYDYMDTLPDMLPENAMLRVTEGLTDFIARHEAEKREALEHRDAIIKKCKDSKKASTTNRALMIAHTTALTWNAILAQIAIEPRSTGWLGSRLDIHRSSALSILYDMERLGMAKKIGAESKTVWVAI